MTAYMHYDGTEQQLNLLTRMLELYEPTELIDSLIVFGWTDEEANHAVARAQDWARYQEPPDS